MCLVAWPLNESEADVDLVLMDTLPLYLSEDENSIISRRKPRRFSTPASLSFKGQATEPDLNAATLCSFTFYPELHSFTPKDISKKNAGYKRNQVCVALASLQANMLA